MSAKKGVIDKYASMRDRDLQLEPYKKNSKSNWQILSDYFMGYTEGPNHFDTILKSKRQQQSGGRKHKLGQSLVEADLISFGNTWVGSIYMGKSTELDVVFDTGSDWLVIESSSCDSCEDDKYDIEPQIKNGEAKELSSEFSERVYGSATVIGREFSDTVCVELSSCIVDFKFFLVYKQTGLREPVDGILGLARNGTMYLNNEYTNSETHLFVY